MKARPLKILVMLALLVGWGCAVWFFFFRVSKPDFDQVGGTILVYEIEPAADNDAGDPHRAMHLAETLQRRLDPQDRGLAIVQALGQDRVEIRLPHTTKDHANEVAQAKLLISISGHLEFRILANSADDANGIEDARKTLAEADEAELKSLQEKGWPPPGPRTPGTKEPHVFHITLANNQRGLITYSWVELSSQERLTLNLDNAAENDPKRNHVWLEAKKNRGKASKLPESANSDRSALNGALFYSRPCADRNLSEEERKQKGVDYFVLSRDPELDPILAPNLPLAQRRLPRMDGSYLTSASVVSIWGGRWDVRAVNAPRHAVQFALNAKGTKLFHELTQKNVPTGQGDADVVTKRHLAIILDGQVMSSPTINAEIPGGRGQITGQFTEREVQNLAQILQTGALPAKLKRVPLSENEVPGK